jgi:hypothetical protein
MGIRQSLISISETSSLIKAEQPDYKTINFFSYNSKESIPHALLIKDSRVTDKNIYQWFSSMDRSNETLELDVLTYDSGSKYRMWTVNKQSDDITGYLYRKLVEKRKYKRAYIIFKASSGIDEIKDLSLITYLKVPTVIIGVLDRNVSHHKEGIHEAEIHNFKYIELGPSAVEAYITSDLEHP